MKRKECGTDAEPVPKRLRGLGSTASVVDEGNVSNANTIGYNPAKVLPRFGSREHDDSVDVVELLSSSGGEQSDEGQSDEDEDYCEVVSHVPTCAAASALPYGTGAQLAQQARQIYDLTTDDLPDAEAPAGPSGSNGIAIAGAVARQLTPKHHDVIDLSPEADSPAARPGPSCSTCPGCQAQGKDTVRKQSLLTAKRQLCAEATVSAHLPNHCAPNAAEAEAEAVAAVAGGPLCCTSCRRLAALAVVEAAQQQVRAIVAHHCTATMTMLRGLVFEVHHTASFNIAAIRSGSLLRAERVEHNYADVRIYSMTDPGATLALAQLKASANHKYLKKLNKPKYAGHLKVVPHGFEAPMSGRRSVLSYDGISSTPASLSALEAAVLMPGDHFFDLAWTETS